MALSYLKRLPAIKEYSTTTLALVFRLLLNLKFFLFVKTVIYHALRMMINSRETIDAKK